MATEKRLIDLDAMFPKESLEEQIRRTINAPTVDAVEVVRCKDCKKSGILEHNGKMFCKEPMGCFGCVPTKPDAFCSYGERRTDV